MFFRCVIAISTLIIVNLSTSTASEWDYKKYGPDAWPILFEKCGGRRQSPVNIVPSTSIYNCKLADIKFSNYDISFRWNMTYNNHTVVFVPNVLSNKQMFVSGSNFNNSFILQQFHLHWGYNNYQGSEHQVDGEKFPLEIHLVHKSNDGILTVIGFLFKVSKQDNPILNPMLSTIRSMNSSFPNAFLNLSLNALLPNVTAINSAGYFRYIGSLTTPPCTESVIWNVFNYTLSISSSQLSILHTKYSGVYFRDVQPLQGRNVFSSKCFSSTCVDL